MKDYLDLVTCRIYYTITPLMLFIFKNNFISNISNIHIVIQGKFIQKKFRSLKIKEKDVFCDLG